MNRFKSFFYPALAALAVLGAAFVGFARTVFDFAFPARAARERLAQVVPSLISTETFIQNRDAARVVPFVSRRSARAQVKTARMTPDFLPMAC